MNILFTSDLSGMGGGETSLVNLSAVLKKDNNISVLCNTNGRLNDILKSNGIQVYELNYRDKKKLIKNLLFIRKLAKNKNIQIIHSNDPLTSIIMHYAVIGLKVKTFWTCHGQWYNFKGLKKLLIKKSNCHIFCVSTKVKESLDGMGVNNTSVAYLRIPLERYENAKPTNLKNELNIPLSNKLIACIGRFQPIKGQLKLVEALNSLIQGGANVTCLLVGGCVFGAEEDKDYYNRVKKYVYDNELERNVIFLGERQDIPAILKEIDCLVIPSDNESFGMIAVEALAAGTPVLSTPNDGVSEILNYDKRFIAATNDAVGLHLLINSYFKYKERTTSEIGNVSNVNERFSISNVATIYMDCFKKYSRI